MGSAVRVLRPLDWAVFELVLRRAVLFFRREVEDGLRAMDLGFFFEAINLVK
jgi:hypothetical protein